MRKTSSGRMPVSTINVATSRNGLLAAWRYLRCSSNVTWNASMFTMEEKLWSGPSQSAIPKRGGTGDVSNQDQREPHGVASEPFFGAARCGARTRQQKPCGAAAMRNARCRFDDGKSTGPKTQEVIERIRKARTIHGRYSAKNKTEQRAYRELLAQCRATLKRSLSTKEAQAKLPA
jgi:hypothetical protein